MELVKTQVQVKVYGNEYNLRMPKASEVIKIQEQIENKENKESDNIKALFSFVHALGLPEEVCNELEIGHFNQLVEMILSKKK